jgi:16S rRNA (guanine1207-N2)-methyltransferase
VTRDRDLNAASLALDVVASPLLTGRALCIDAPDALADALERGGSSVARWRRYAVGGPAAALPPDGPFDAAFLRMPRSRDALRLAAHQIAAALSPGAPLYVFGNNDEGIKSAAATLAPLFEPVVSVDARRHARLVRGLRALAAPTPDPDAWLTSRALALPGGARVFVSYPGCFAKGGLDAGTAVLIGALGGALAELGRAAPRVLDLACGIGVIAAAVHDLAPEASIDGCDADALAVRAAARNARFARLAVGDGPAAIEPPSGGWDLIVSNPPVHDGFDDDTRIVGRWASAIAGGVAPGGLALFVVQRHRAVQADLRAAFSDVEVVEERAGYRVYRCR